MTAWHTVLRGTLIYWFLLLVFRFLLRRDVGSLGVAARVVAHISEDTLHDAFGTREVGNGLLKACEIHIDALEAAVVARFRVDPRWPLMITLDDFPARRGLSGTEAAHRSPEALR
ncbi:hypothetical protein AB6807_35210 [Variovorax sp. RCC_210]